MILKILGAFDIISAILFWLYAFFHIIPSSFIVFTAFYLIIKGVFFLISADIASALDILSSLLIFLSLTFTLPKIIVILIVIYLLQKGIFSLVS